MRAIRRSMSLLLLPAALGLAGCPGGGSAFEVTTRSDAADGDTSSPEALAANPGPDGGISLREALLAANNGGGAIAIGFAVRGVIDVLGDLPALSEDAITIDGGGSITLDGGLRPALTRGIEIVGASNTVRGLTIVGFPGDGVLIAGASATANAVEGCRIGNTGEAAAKNRGAGVRIRNGANANFIGGTAAAARNAISGNDGFGVVIESTGSSVTRDNAVSGNYIGLNAAGNRALPNGLGGVSIDSARNTDIGTAGGGARNVISGNNGPGIAIVAASAAVQALDNAIQGNRIGTNAAGSAAIGNTLGIELDGQVFDTPIGGTADAQANTIAGNRDGGVRIAVGARNTVRRNAIFDNGDNGIELVGGANASMPAPTIAGFNPARGRAPAGAIVELFIDAGAEGGLFAGRTTANAAGNWSLDIDLADFEAQGLNLTATATDAAGNTSEFSTAIPID